MDELEGEAKIASSNIVARRGLKLEDQHLVIEGRGEDCSAAESF
jgi:hypothetical protein